MTWSKGFKTKHLTLDSHYCVLYAIAWNTINRDVRTPHPESKSLEDSCTLVFIYGSHWYVSRGEESQKPCGERWSLVSHGHSNVTLVTDNNQNLPLTRRSVLCCCDAVANTVAWPRHHLRSRTGNNSYMFVCVCVCGGGVVVIFAKKLCRLFSVGRGFQRHSCSVSLLHQRQRDVCICP